MFDNLFFRFLAREFGLAGKNNLENGQADEIVDAVSDLQTAMVNASSKDEKAMQNVLDNVYPAGLVCNFCYIKILFNISL